MTESRRDATPQSQALSRSRTGWSRLLVVLILVMATVAVFWPVLGHEFLAYDDSVNVYQNPYLQARSLDNLMHFWRYPFEGLYAPLTYTGFALASWLPSLLSTNPSAAVTPDPRVFHGMNLLLHLLSVLIVWRIIEQLLRRTCHNGAKMDAGANRLPLEWAACGGALLFAIHPIQVEAVAWATGFKDLLFGLLSFAAVWLFLKSVDAKIQSGASRTSRAGLYY